MSNKYPVALSTKDEIVASYLNTHLPIDYLMWALEEPLAPKSKGRDCTLVPTKLWGAWFLKLGEMAEVPDVGIRTTYPGGRIYKKSFCQSVYHQMDVLVSLRLRHNSQKRLTHMSFTMEDLQKALTLSNIK